MSADRYAALDAQLAAWADELDVLRYVNDTEQPPDYDPEEAAADLAAVIGDAPDTPLGDLYRKTAERLQAYNDIIRYRGDGDRVREATVRAYGRPSSDQTATARELLDAFDPVARSESTDTADDMQAAVSDLFDAAGMDDWSAIRDDGAMVTYVSQAAREIRIPDRDIQYDVGAKDAYAHHEFQHALRGANGAQQPYSIFRYGAGRYNATDEGLSALLEFVASTLEHQIDRLRTFALRTLASDAVLNDDASYEATVDRLEQYADSGAATATANRAHRGGGFAKDHIYLAGLQDVAAYLRDADDRADAVETLYVGKFGVDDVGTVERLLDDGTVRPPTRTPLPVLDEQDLRTAATVFALDQGMTPG